MATVYRLGTGSCLPSPPSNCAWYDTYHAHCLSPTPIDVERLKAVDLEVAVDIQSFDRTQSAAESAHAKISPNSGHLSLHLATLVYHKGEANLDLQLDAKHALNMRFTFDGEKLGPWRALNIFDSDSLAPARQRMESLTSRYR